jgi:CheY-like chemotaxis protein
MRKFAFKINLTVILTITMGLVLGLASVALILLDVKRETGEFTEDVRVRGLSLSTAVSDVFAGPIASNDAEALANAVRETRIRRELAYPVIFSPDGPPIYEEANTKFYSISDRFGPKAIATETVVQRTNKGLIEFAGPIMLDGQAIAGVQYGFSTEGLDGLMASVIKHRLMQTALLVLVVVVAALLISRYLKDSIRSLMSAVHAVSAGGEYVSGKERVSEFALLSDAVGDMVTNLQQTSNVRLADPEKVESLSVTPEPQEGLVSAAPASRPYDIVENPVKAASEPAPPVIRVQDRPIVQPVLAGLDEQSRQYLKEVQSRMDQAILQANVAEDAAQMATKSAHSINNLVTPITAYSKMARQNLPEDSPLVVNMQEIEEAGNRIAQLATEIQQFVPVASLIEVPEVETERVSTRVEDVIENDVFIDLNSIVALVVDDERMVRKVTVAILEAEGYTVIEASSGVEAVEVARRYSAVPFRLLVTDVLMPMMGAKDLAAIMSDIHPEALVVFTSGYAAESLIGHGAMATDTTFIQKPLSREGLLEKIEEAEFARTIEINEAVGTTAETG